VNQEQILITGYVRRSVAVAVVVAVGAVWAMPGKAQQRRRGGPSDWSHSRIMASRFGPDADQDIAKNWRTVRKHMLLDRAHASRDPYQDWLEKWFPALVKPAKQADAPHLDWNLKTGGYGSVVGSPAKYNTDLTANDCTDVIYFTVDQAGAAGPTGAVNVIAITNPYAGCAGNAGGTTPTVKFGIALPYGTATSAVPSLDGTVLYVIESRPSGNGGMILHAINVDNITTTPGAYNFSTGKWTSVHTLLSSPIGTPTSDQLFQFTYTGVTNNVASPYLDYSTNDVYFGDSAGRIHRVTGSNTAAAAKYLSNGFPVACGAAQLQSPVFYANQVITASADGKLYRVATTGATPYSCVGSVQGGAGTGSVGGGMSAPVIDVTNSKIISGANDSNGGGGRGYGAFDLNFASGALPTSFTYTGVTNTTTASVPPTFDDAFWSSNNGSLYAAGSNVAGTATYLLRVSYNAGAMGGITGNAGLTHTGGVAVVTTSPVTEFLTGAASAPDYLFVGGTTGTYKYMNRISAGFTGSNASPSVMTSSFAPAEGISSGIIIDTNSSNMTGATALANIYFGTVGVASTIQSTIVQLAQAF
jgi:hypothetical protein